MIRQEQNSATAAVALLFALHLGASAEAQVASDSRPSAGFPTSKGERLAQISNASAAMFYCGCVLIEGRDEGVCKADVPGVPQGPFTLDRAHGVVVAGQGHSAGYVSFDPRLGCRIEPAPRQGNAK